MPAPEHTDGQDTDQLSTFVFADLAGYTALTDAHGDERAADLAADYYSHARELLVRWDGEEVKLIGDEMMARVRDPAAAIQLAVELSHHEMRRHEHLAVRVGLHHGTAVARGADWFGAAVNIAARLTGLAEPGEVLTSAETAQAAGPIDGVSYSSRGQVELKNVRRRVEVLGIRCGEEHAELVVDPVCRMLLDPHRAAARLEHAGAEYHFCSAECRLVFEAEPDAFLQARA